MRTVKVKRSDLRSKLEENRAQHRETFLKAQEHYRAALIEELDRMLADARDGHRVKRAITLPEPEDHTSDYDQVISMLDMSVDEEVVLDYDEFRRFVMDEWGWKASWTENTASYVAEGG